MDILKQLIELEFHLLKPEVRESKAQLDRYLHDDFLEIPSFGISYDKAHALSRIPDETAPSFHQQNHELRILGDDIYQIVYQATVKKPEESVKYSMRNSIWVRNNGQWQMIFHQGTNCPAFELRVSE